MMRGKTTSASHPQICSLDSVSPLSCPPRRPNGPRSLPVQLDAHYFRGST